MSFSNIQIIGILSMVGSIPSSIFISNWFGGCLFGMGFMFLLFGNEETLNTNAREEKQNGRTKNKEKVQ